MIQYYPSITGSLTVNGSVFITGSINATAGITGSATTASYVLQAISSSYALTASYVNPLTQSLSVSGAITTTGTLTAQTLVVQTITSSIVYSSGSNIFGNSLTNTQQFTGSVLVTGSITQSGTNTTSSFAGLVGIGTTSPSYSLDVTGTGRFSGNVVLSGSDSRFNGGDSVGRLILSNSNTTTYIGLYGATHPTIPYVMSFVVNSAAALTLASTGAATFSANINVGGSSFSNTLSTGNIDLANGAGLFGYSNQTYLSNNLYYNGNFTYKATAGASLYNQDNTGAHLWYTVPSGTINTTATLTERMRITASGSVGIGTSSPNYGGWGLATSILSATSSAIELATSRTTVGTTIGGVDYIQTSNTTNKEVAQISALNVGSTAGNTGADLVFLTKPDAGSITERMRITSGGNIGIGGVTNPVAAFHITTTATGTPTIPTLGNINSYVAQYITNGAGGGSYGLMTGTLFTGNAWMQVQRSDGTATAYNLIMQPNGGNVLIGTTTDNGRLTIDTGTTTGIYLNKTAPNSGTTYIYQNFYRAGSLQIGSITHDSNSGATSYNTSSDYRLKEDFKDFNGIEILSKIKFYDFIFKTGNERMQGVIAHELKEILPYSVFGEKDAFDENGNMLIQQVDYSKLVPILGKAIQELSAKVTELENIVATK